MTPISSSVRKWGNSVAVRIPKPLADKLSLEDGRVVHLTEDGSGGLRITRAVADELLVALLARITKDTMPEYPDWGSPVGKEVW